jgi:predicted nucleotidyltransferase
MMMSAAAQAGLAPLEVTRRETNQEIVAETVRACLERYGSRVQAVILTGSVARGEATIVVSGGLRRVLGDADFLVVFGRQAKLPAAAEVDSIAKSATESLERQSITCAVHIAAVRPRYLVRLPAHIFSYELRHASRVVMGDESILRLVPAFSPAQIDREDAWRLLSNRLIEWLEAREKSASRADSPSIDLSYATVKLWIDSATSLLVFLGEYEPGYAARAARLATLKSDSTAALPFSFAEFGAGVAEATSWKLRPETFAADSFGWSFCEEARRFAVRLWRWELAQMTGQNTSLPPLTLCGAFSRRLPRKKRLRGWLSVARQAGSVTAWHHRRRWSRLSREGSPRHWLYAVAAECAIREEECATQPAGSSPAGPWAQTLHGFLPIPDRASGTEGEWGALVRDLAWNYHEFVERTRA